MVREATLQDCLFMSTRLREADCNEIKAAGGSDPLSSLVEGLLNSSNPRVGVNKNNEPVIMWGVIPTSEYRVGSVWALATNELAKDHRIQFLRHSRRYVEELHIDFDLVFNVVDARNDLHIQWLRWLDFTFIKAVPNYGPEKRLFYEFVRIANV